MIMSVFRRGSLHCLCVLAAGVSLATAQVPDSLMRENPAGPPSSSLPPDSSSAGQPVRQVSYIRLAVMGGITLGFLGGSYLYVKKYWWADQQTTFHFDRSPEQYAKNMDKVCHFFWGYVGGDMASAGFRWAGIDDNASLVYGGVMNMVISLAIEMTDGYAPLHGFSVMDFTAGAVGGFYPLLQRNIRFLQPLNFKMSYWNHAPDYYSKGSQLKEHNPVRFFADNYANQTYWALLNLQQISPRSWSSWMPGWLSFAVGVRAGDVVPVIQTDRQFQNVHVYLSVDVDVPQLLPKEGPLWGTLRTVLKYFHFPAPALRISPSFAGFALYM
jgi:hypothetical protein